MSSKEFKNYYAILGVKKTATNREIKQKFRQLALKYHPDRNQGNKAAEAKFKEISEAYDVLYDEEKRAKYDQFGQYWAINIAPEEYTESSTPNSQSNSRSRSSHKTKDINTDSSSQVEFDSANFSQYGDFDEFIDELLGRFSTPGNKSTSPSTPTPRSKSSDFTRTTESTSTSKTSTKLTNEVTSITLTYAEAFKGVIKQVNIKQETVEVTIHAGAKPGSQIRIAGKGKPNLLGNPKDLYLEVKLTPHSFFSFEGDNLVCEVPISPDEAVLGSSISIPTPDGVVATKIPAGINSGQVLRLRGKGWYSAEGDRTDQLVRIVVATPQQLSPLERDYYEKIRNLRRENPRSGLDRIEL